MDQDLIEKVMKEVTAEMQTEGATAAPAGAGCGLTEFVGTAIGNTYGLVIASLDPLLVEPMNVGQYRSIGIIGSRTGAGPHILAADDAVKATNTEIISIELPRDTEGSGGHGCLILFGADDVSDARRAVEITLDVLPKYFGDVYTVEGGNAGTNFLEFQYTARASMCINKAFGSPVGKAFGFTNGCPAAIGVVMADICVKAANVDVVALCTPKNGGTSFSNEYILAVTGDSGAVRQAIRAAIAAGKDMLAANGGTVVSATTPYI